MAPSTNKQLLTTPSEKAKAAIRNRDAVIRAKSAGLGAEGALIKKPAGRHGHDYNIHYEMKNNGKVEVSKDEYNNIVVSGLGRSRFTLTDDNRIISITPSCHQKSTCTSRSNSRTERLLYK